MPPCCGALAPRVQRSERRRSFRPTCSMTRPCSASYPALSAAIGAGVGLIGALTIGTATRYLNARDVDGTVIGEGLAPRVVEALLTMLAENARFRDLPVGVLDNSAVDDERLPNL